MTEKRFSYNYEGNLNGLYNILDNHMILTHKQIVDLLNCLNDENEQLKRVLKDKDELLKKTLQVNNNLQKELEKCQIH